MQDAQAKYIGILWYIEWLSSMEAHMHGIEELIYDGRTKYQRVTIARTGSFGLVLFLDGYAQSSEEDEFIYHESLVHPAMLTHPHPRSVLVVGGGEGATIREVLKHESVQRVVMVDIDRELVELAKKYLHEWHRGSFDDPRVELVFMDGKEYIENTNEKFDVIILDLTDPIKDTPGVLLYTKEFYESVKKALTPEGVMVTQATSARYYLRAFSVINNTVSTVFPVARPYKVFVPAFYSEWGFVLGSLSRDPLAIPRAELEERLGKLNLRFLDLDHYYFLFKIPRYMEEKMRKYREISTMSHPLEISL
ncbi:polyamine aminopropyltransferase [Infirmifilum lucidum]|uniref:Polyamine aminopropyltransferase n=1 Tax=Infirmifilum lucidum TaxID=2776706 RepID=A0A7L9FHU6_9CREN|nr:polyamine aminopropyltransferase [Infirmifilum lucidum]QOJ78486.1 polyamine aminopropyltransferase [Infirmifilum lucidum]